MDVQQLVEDLKNGDRRAIFRIIAIVVGALFILLVFISFFQFKDNDAYRAAVKKIEASQEIAEVTGGIKGYGFMPSGSISITGDSGEADLNISVKGNLRDIDVYVKVRKPYGGEWQVVHMVRTGNITVTN